MRDEDRAGAPLVAVVSEGLAEALWPGKDPIGQCMQIAKRTAPCTTVVGVAENIRQGSLREPEKLQYYLSFEQFGRFRAGLFVRTRGDARAHTEAVRRRLQPLMPGAGYVSVTPMRDAIDPEQRSWQLGATMFMMFGGPALVLAAIGLYGVVAYTVAQRTQEIGVRIALGARAADVVRLVLGDGVRFAMTGIALGGVVALGAGRWIGPMLYGTSPRDPLVYAVVAAVLLLAAVAASAVPALRAARLDPNLALRVE